LVAADGAAGDWFGSGVALSADGSRALIGAEFDITGAGKTGSARVFVRSGSVWSEEATLVAVGGDPFDRFGASVTLTADASRALISMPYDETAAGLHAGSARVFLRSGSSWTEEATLVAPDGVAEDYFGGDVSLSADGIRALVGAEADDTPAGPGAGTAHVFVRSDASWTEEAMLLPSDGAARDWFGLAVSLSADGSVALIGAALDDTAAGTDTGSARIFVRSGTTWIESATLLAPDARADDSMGYAVSLSGDGSRALVGVERDDTPATSFANGSARLFVGSGGTWSQVAVLVAPDSRGYDRFGNAVALAADGSRALVGAYFDDVGSAVDTGSAHVFVLAP
jgi:hypothetical protein